MGAWISYAIAAQVLASFDPAWHEPCNLSWQFTSSMLETLAIALVVLWLLGLVSSYTMGGLIHILLVAAMIMILLRVIRGDKPLA